LSVKLAILQARMSSSRLPGKVMAPVLGEPMIGRQIERLQRAREIDRLLVATSSDPSDDALADYCKSLDVGVFRGALNDVLDRYAKAVERIPAATTVVRVTADCPLTDPALIDKVIVHHLEVDADYTSNTLTRTYPHGLDVEVIRRETLEQAWERANDPYEREHVTPYIYRHPERFRLAGVAQHKSQAGLRWTVDVPADLAFVREVYAKLYPFNPEFTTVDVLALPVNTAPVPA
jgi:spore coat polysaccharide biosynthesis protein SpsF